MKVTIEVNEKQAQVIKEALDLYSRIIAGQFNEIIHIIANKYCSKLSDICWGEFHSSSKELNEAKMKMMSVLGLNSPYASFGIGSEIISDDSKVAYDILQVLRNRIAWHKEPSGDIRVDFDTPLQFGTQQLCKVEVKE